MYVQDDPEFFAAVDAHDDTDLSLSWHHDVETVPTLLRVVDGTSRTARSAGTEGPGRD